VDSVLITGQHSGLHKILFGKTERKILLEKRGLKGKEN
jgi:hypothetical protein